VVAKATVTQVINPFLSPFPFAQFVFLNFLNFFIYCAHLMSNNLFAIFCLILCLFVSYICSYNPNNLSIICSLIFFVIDQGVVATVVLNVFITQVADSSVQHILRILFSQVPVQNIKRFESYSNHFVCNIPSHSGLFNMLHTAIKHQSKEVITALDEADRVDDPDDILVVTLLGVSGTEKTRISYDSAKE
jgi:hypothetical protein